MVSAFCVYFTAILENDIAVGGNTISSHVEMLVAYRRFVMIKMQFLLTHQILNLTLRDGIN